MHLLNHAIAVLGTTEGGFSVLCIFIAVILAIPINQPSRGPKQSDLRDEKIYIFPFSLPIKLGLPITIACAVFFFAVGWCKIDTGTTANDTAAKKLAK